MNENLDLTTILTDCPKGTKFYSSIHGNVKFDGIRDNRIMFVFTDNVGINNTSCVLSSGLWTESLNGECILFPSKEQRDWSKWHRPFEDGDIVRYSDCIAIFNGWGDETLFRTYVTAYLHGDSTIDVAIPLFGKAIRRETRFATEEEKQKLFNAIKANGYKWNAETKTLEKLIVPKFKVGDRIKHIVGREEIATVKEVKELHYNLDSKVGTSSFSISLQDEWEFIPNKFDISTLQPFDKVLVRINDDNEWHVSLFSHMSDYTSFCYKFVTIAGRSDRQIVPYNEETKHLLGTTDKAPEKYINWE